MLLSVIAPHKMKLPKNIKNGTICFYWVYLYEKRLIKFFKLGQAKTLTYN